MGAGASATQMIFFITSVIIALGVVGALFMNIQSLTSAATIGSKTLSEQLKTDITVINDPQIIPYDSGTGNYTFYVKNTGKEELGINYITLIIDGKVFSNTGQTILGSDDMWFAGDVLSINVTISPSLAQGSHNLRVIAENGIEDEFAFRTT